MVRGVEAAIAAALETRRRCENGGRQARLTPIPDHDRPAPLEAPRRERIAASNMAAFMKFVNDRHGTALADYDSLHRFSVERMEDFWVAVWDFCGVVAETRGDTVIADKAKMPGARFFPEARLNFAENLLRHSDEPGRRDRLLGRGQGARAPHARASCATRSRACSRRSRAAGVKAGRPRGRLHAQHARDRRRDARQRRAWARSSPRARRTSACRAWSTASARSSRRCSLCCDGYHYNGKVIESLAAHRRDRGAAADGRARGRRALRLARSPDVAAVAARRAAGGLPRALRAEGARRSRRCPSTTRSTSSIPSGTTGVPKCIVHGAGGMLLQHLKEHVLHCDVKPRRPPVLLHHLRLDDVELARLGPRRGRDAAALRRLALPRARQRPLRLRATPRA